MNNYRLLSLMAVWLCMFGCKATETAPVQAQLPFTWDNATIYFMMTDRFYDGDASNNYKHTDENPPAALRGYMGGDIKGITQKINEGYFSKLGVNAIWMTPVVEQILGSVDEGTGNSFGFHGYWTRDWTALDAKFGTEADLAEMVKTAHKNGIRVMIDAVANHTGPVTDKDPVWPDEWVKTGPQCNYQTAESTINCTLVANLPDIKTESMEEVTLPPGLVAKWKNEGRYEQEVKELDEWFAKTGYKRTAVNHILKWLVDFIDDYGIDAFRVDTVKHTEAYVWDDLYKQAIVAYDTWKKSHPEDRMKDDTDFYMMGEVYNYSAGRGRMFDYGDKKVDFFANGFNSLINFDFKYDAQKPAEEIFTKYDGLLHNEFKGKSVVHYLSSHDDGAPYDADRQKPFETATKLLLAPGGVQIYYGDETARKLNEQADGDAVLRSFMNWDQLESNEEINGNTVQDVLAHWRKLGSFRGAHPSIGAGRHQKIGDAPYTFSRKYTSANGLEDQVIVALDVDQTNTSINVSSVFKQGVKVKDAYSGKSYTVKDGKIDIGEASKVVLLELR